MEDWQGRNVFAEYDNFRLEPESDWYRLRLGNYNGNAGDSLSWHSNKAFTTLDRDKDAYSGDTLSSIFVLYAFLLSILLTICMFMCGNILFLSRLMKLLLFKRIVFNLIWIMCLTWYSKGINYQCHGADAQGAHMDKNV